MGKQPNLVSTDDPSDVSIQDIIPFKELLSLEHRPLLIKNGIKRSLCNPFPLLYSLGRKPTHVSDYPIH